MDLISDGLDYIYKEGLYGLRFLTSVEDDLYIPQDGLDKCPFDLFVDCMEEEPGNVLFREDRDLIVKRHLCTI